MSDVKRYDLDSDDPCCFITESVDGDWVHFTDLELLRSDLQSARKALRIIKRSLDESVDRGINDNRMKHMLEVLLTSEEYETVTAALNAELEKKEIFRGIDGEGGK